MPRPTALSVSGVVCRIASGAAVALLLALPSAQAADKPINCDRTTVESEQISCAQKDLAANQKKLDVLMRRGSRQLPANALPLFTAAQTAWIGYRDAECAWNALDLDNGTTNELARLTCLSDLTSSRIDELGASIGGP